MSASTPSQGPHPAKRRSLLLASAACGAAFGYGCLAVFLYLIGLQSYRWFRDGEWMHFGVTDGLRFGLSRCCVGDPDTGRLATLMHWLDAPVDWLGLHKVLEIVPASLALFALSIAGNSVYIYCRDRMDDCRDRMDDRPASGGRA